MHRRFASADRIHSARTDLSRSPYAKNYRTNLTHDQRELLSHRQNVSKIQRRDLEDRYIALMDEHFSLKKDNAYNHEKIKKLATKLLRMSADGKHRGAPFPVQLAPNENLEIQIVKLESYNALLKDRLNAVIRRFGNSIRSSSVVGTRPPSCTNLSLKRKLTISQDDLNLLEIPEPPNSARSKIGDDRKYPPNKCKCKCIIHNSEHHDHQRMQQDQSQEQQLAELSIVGEKIGKSRVPDTIVVTPASPDDKININDLKNTIQKLENDLEEAMNDSKKIARVNAALEERLTNEILSKRISENVELIELRRTVTDCDAELTELKREYLTLKNKTETELDEEQRKIAELSSTIDTEVERNKMLSEELASLKNATHLIESINEETQNIQMENRILKDLHKTSDTNVSNNRSNNNQETMSKLIEQNQELSKLLNESSQTIRELRNNLESIRSSKGESRGADDEKHENEDAEKSLETHPRIPLEPHVEIVNPEQSDRRRQKQSNVGVSGCAKSSKKDPSSHQTNANNEKKSSESSAGGTYNIQENENAHPKTDTKSKRNDESHDRLRIKNRQKVLNQETASEVSSIDSDDNYRSFKKKNRDMQNSLLLMNQNGRPLDFTARLNMLERAAYYQPLSTRSQQDDNDKNLTCNCTQSGCYRNQSIYEEIHIAVENAKVLLLKEFKNYPFTEPNESHTKSTSINGFEESSECREFLRVQYNLNNLYRQELEFMCKSCKEQTEMLLNEIDVLKDKLRVYEEKIQSLESSTSDVDRVIGAVKTGYSPKYRVLDMSRDQGLLEIHVESFKLTKEGHGLLSCKHGAPGSLYFSWIFYNLETESRTSLRKGPAYVFQNACVYLVDIRRSFLQYIKNNQLEIRLLAEVGSSSIVVGKSLLNLSEILIFPQNKIQLDTRVMSVDTECASHLNSLRMCSCQGTITRRKHLGNLSVWFRLTCEMNVLKDHAEQLWLDDKSQNHEEHTKNAIRKKVKINRKNELQITDRETECSSADTDDRDVRFCEDESEAVVDQDRKLSARHKEITVSPKPLQPNEIAITIESLVLLIDGDIMTNASVQKFYVEYNFFGSNETHSMNKSKASLTPSTSSTSTISINCRKVFRIKDNAHDPKSCQRFERLLKNPEKNIKFVIVSESRRKERHNRDDNNEWLEIALGLLHLGKIVTDADDNSDKETLRISVMSKNHPYNNVGYLEITIEGIQLMKKISDENI